MTNLARAGLLAGLLALTIAVSAASGSPARGYECDYKQSRITIALDGFGNSGTLCLAFVRAFRGTPTWGHPGRVRCAWIMRSGLDVRVRVFAVSAFRGSLFCALLAENVSSSDWRRTL